MSKEDVNSVTALTSSFLASPSSMWARPDEREEKEEATLRERKAASSLTKVAVAAVTWRKKT